MKYWWAELGWLGAPFVSRGVLISTEAERIVTVEDGILSPPSAAVRLHGLLLPGFANVHSHAFHRALRGRTHGGTGDFWTWRNQMYKVAQRLDPETYYSLARATYAEMALAGITAVGEFHYLHHADSGKRYSDPNAMGHALVAAAQDAGVRLTLLDTCYLQADMAGTALEGTQLRFSDSNVEDWADRVTELKAPVVGAAVHSVRALSAKDMTFVAQWSGDRDLPLHIHLSEQRVENEACMALSGLSPTQLAHECGVLGPNATAVHATHVSEKDIALLGGSKSSICMCPTTERDLADGIGPASALARAGSALTLGSDSHAVVDLFEEARAVELNERLSTETRGQNTPIDLLRAATSAGMAALGRKDGGILAPGMVADWVTLNLDTPRLAGASEQDLLAAVVFAGIATDISDVIVGGRVVVKEGRHQLIEDVPGVLRDAIFAVMGS